MGAPGLSNGGANISSVEAIWAALNMGFFFSHRGSDNEQMRQIDVEVEMGGRARKLTLFIYRPRTDRSKRGCFRTLVASDIEICPAKPTISYLPSPTWDCESRALLFTVGVSKKSMEITKRMVPEYDLEAKRFVAHSPRGGGAKPLYVMGISIEHIRRFGRCESDTSPRYLYRDSQISRCDWAAVIKEVGLLDQLQMTMKRSEVATGAIFSDEEYGTRTGGSSYSSPCSAHKDLDGELNENPEAENAKVGERIY